MISLRTLNRRAGSVFAVAALVLSTALPGLASAATVTERSIELSSATKNADNVTYNISFKTDTGTSSTEAFVVDFCDNTPLIGEPCSTTNLTGFTTASVATAGPNSVTSVDANTVKVTLGSAVAAEGAVSVPLTGIHNPQTAGTMYARITTYATAAAMNAAAPAGYDTATSVGTNKQDEGGVALSFNDSIGVSAAVMESLQFCMSKAAIGNNCDFTGTPYEAPTLKLGREVETGVFALDSQDIYTGIVNTQLSTNAVGGAVVNVKSNQQCGGLHRAGAASNLCDIVGAGTTGSITAGQAKFGIMTGTAITDATDGDFGPTGTYASGSYRLDNAGVLSAYGEPILTTNSKPANNRNMQLTFGASAANNTPAGNYSAALSLIATGKF